MKTRRTKTRRTKIGVFHCEVSASWGNSQLRFIDHLGDERKEVWIHIGSPGDVDYIKEQLDKIVAGWKHQLDVIGPNSLTRRG